MILAFLANAYYGLTGLFLAYSAIIIVISDDVRIMGKAVNFPARILLAATVAQLAYFQFREILA